MNDRFNSPGPALDSTRLLYNLPLHAPLLKTIQNLSTPGSRPTIITMDIVDRDLEKAEREASPERFPDPTGDLEKAGKDDRRNTFSTTHTDHTDGSSSSASVIREEIGMSRVGTTRDLERHPTELSRIETQKSQHSGTVGRSLKSRESKKPLPPFGAGKEYPPPLPAREDYVVEFDGPDDPMHPQNWPLKKKYGNPPLFWSACTNLTVLS